MIDNDRIQEITQWHLDNARNYDQLLKGDREEAQYYYYGQWPKPPKANRSRHISYDVLDAVEEMKAEFIEIFLSSDSPLKFMERTKGDYESAQMAWLYVHDMFTRRNRGTAVLHDVLYDAMTMKMGVFHVCWEEKKISATREFNGITQMAMDELLLNPNMVLDDYEVEVDKSSGERLFTGNMIETLDQSKVAVRCVPPENFLLPEQAVDDDEPDFVAERTYPRTAELQQWGYSDDDIATLEDYFPEEETLNRNYRQDIMVESNDEPFPKDSGRQRKIVYRCVIEAEFEKGDGLQYWEVIMGWGGPVLEVNPIDSPGYFWWSPIRIAHKSVGLSIADLIKHIQTAKTTLRRGLLDNVVASNIPRRLVNTAFIKRVNQLTDNRIGGIIETSDVDRSVRELPPNPINPASFEVLNMLDMEKEARTGQTGINSGRNADVINHQNSEGLIQSYARNGKKRTSAQARLFADNCFAPMFKYMLELGVQHETAERLIPLMGEMIMVNPGAWQNMQFDMDTQVALTPDDRKADANNYMMLHQALEVDPKLAAIYQDTNRHAVLSNICRLLGLPPELILTSLESPAYQQAKQSEAQAQQVQMAMTQAQTGWLETQQQVESMKMELEKLSRALESQARLREVKVKERELLMRDDLERDKMSNTNTVEFAKIKQKADDSKLDADVDLAKLEKDVSNGND